MRKIYIIIPSLSKTAPVKGAIDLSNHLIKKYKVLLIFLKGKEFYVQELNEKVEYVNLSQIKGWNSKLKHFKTLLNDSDQSQSLSISYGLSADIFNFFIRKKIKTISSIRGHLINTYREDYGIFGFFIAFIHLSAVSQLNYVIAMTDFMGRHIEKITNKKSIIIGNFINENTIEKFRFRITKPTDEFNFIYAGRLSKIKKVDVLINSIYELNKEGLNCTLNIYGKGILENKLKDKVKYLNLKNKIKFYGHLDDLWKHASFAHSLILPSASEGVSRSVLEALYLGIPCVLRDVDSNNYVIENNVTGVLFREDNDLKNAIKNITLIAPNFTWSRPNLLKVNFRQSKCTKQYSNLIDSILE